MPGRVGRAHIEATGVQGRRWLQTPAEPLRTAPEEAELLERQAVHRQTETSLAVSGHVKSHEVDATKLADCSRRVLEALENLKGGYWMHAQSALPKLGVHVGLPVALLDVVSKARWQQC